MKFSHAGNIGDAVFSLLFVTELSEYVQEPIEEFHLQTGKKCVYSQPHVFGNEQLPKAAAEFLKPLLEYQGFRVSISDYVPEGFIDLDSFRKNRLNFASNDIRLWPYSLTNVILPMDLQRKILKAPLDDSRKGQIALIKTRKI